MLFSALKIHFITVGMNPPSLNYHFLMVTQYQGFCALIDSSKKYNIYNQILILGVFIVNLLHHINSNIYVTTHPSKKRVEINFFILKDRLA
jgi:hypothetical protein